MVKRLGFELQTKAFAVYKYVSEVFNYSNKIIFLIAV